MTRSELIARIAAHYHNLTAADTGASVAVILTAIGEQLATEGGRVEVRGFGSFSVNHRPPRIGRNPATGAQVTVPAKHVPHFKPGAELHNRVAASALHEKRSSPHNVMEPELEPG